ncbi:MAG: hypothetical protein JWQ71_3458 [Pedosphaera sp.]|nr:hypothetical protein [Pedosphaera sp.]
MQSVKYFTLLLFLLGISLVTAVSGTPFTYQGRLNDSGSIANGTYDLRFVLCDTDAGPFATGYTNLLPGVSVTNGLIIAQLDFGAAAFTGGPRWIEIGVRTNGSVSPYTALYPRQALTATPFAMQSQTAVSITGPVNDSQLSENIPKLNTNVVYAGSVTATKFVGDGLGLTNVAQSTNGEIWLADLKQIHLSDQAGMYYFRNHGGSPSGAGEWQNDSQDSISWTIGLNGAQRAVAQMGGSGPYHEVWFFQYDLVASALNPKGYSKYVGFAAQYWSNGGRLYKYPGFRAEAKDTNGNVVLRLYSDIHGFSQNMGVANVSYGELGTNYLGIPVVYATNAIVVGDSSLAPLNASALVDLQSTNKAFYPPRMTKAQRNAIQSPGNGATIWQTDSGQGTRVYNGTNWMRYAESID